jgi:DNA (cytosine-5)-methyltransferase 1
MENDKLKALSVCTGTGQLEEEILRRYGIELVGYSEYSRNIARTYEARHPGVKNYGDLTKIDPEELPHFDVLIGGTPCTSFSIAGGRAGLGGESGLLVHFIRLLRSRRVPYILWENVEGSLTSTGGWDFAYFHGELADLGYSFRWDLLRAPDHGVPQARERVFLVGHLEGVGRSLRRPRP